MNAFITQFVESKGIIVGGLTTKPQNPNILIFNGREIKEVHWTTSQELAEARALKRLEALLNETEERKKRLQKQFKRIKHGGNA
jgi:hypothetical protein